MKENALIKGTVRIIGAEIDKDKAERINKSAHLRLRELMEENINDSPALRKHTFSRIYPGIAVYEAMRSEEIPSEKAVWCLREYYQQYCKIPAAAIRTILKIPGLYRKVPSLLLKTSLRGFSEASGFVYRFPEHSANETCFDIVKCPYYETCCRYGHPEITKAFCDSDDVSYGDMHPKLIWGRTQTIGHGADCCNFKLTLVD